MKIRALICIWLVVLLGLATCGAGLPDIGLSSNQGRYSLGLKTALQNGGGQSGWDTLLSVYSTRTGMGDTLIGTAALDTFNARWHAKKSLADDVVKWGTDDATFAYAALDSEHVGVSYWPTAAIASRPTQFRWRATGQGGVTHPVPTATRWAMTDSTAQPRQLLVHFDPQIPAGSTIVWARLHFYAINTTASSTQDTIVATLMTTPADSVWWRHKGINDNGSYTLPNASKASYSYQWFATGSSPNYGYTNAGSSNAPVSPWTPALSTRARWWQWGDVSDWTKFASGFTPASGDLPVDVTNCVQAIVNGAQNNGIMITRTKQTTSDRIMAFYNFDQTNTALERCYVPWLEIKYLTKRYSAPFPGGKDIAFVWQTDDGKIAFNDSLADAFLDHGGRFTMFLCDSLTLNDPGAMDYEHAASLHDQGFEIGWHSKRHRAGPASQYLTLYERIGATAALYDSLRVEMSPQILYNRATAIGRPDLEASPLWGKSMALPGYPYSPWVVRQASEYGYNILRVGTAIPYTTTAGANWVLPTYAAARTDTARGHMPASLERAPRNMMLLPLTSEINQIVGEKANTTITEDQVRFNFRKLLRQAKAQNRPVVSLYEHNFKSGSYSYGVDPEEMRWMLREAVAQGAWITTASEYSRWIELGSTAIATPVGYAQPDSFRFSADDRVWFKPNGVDNRWIRGVK